MSGEQRLQKRVSNNLLTKVTMPMAEFFGYVQDLAKSGLGLTCNRRLEVGTELKLSINVPQRSALVVTGKVVWRRDLPVLSKNRYQVGVALTEENPEYQKYIEAQLKHEYERRRHVRYSDILEVKSEDVIDLLDSATADISAGGLYIRTNKPLPVGAQYELALVSAQLPKTIYCLGEVVNTFECDPDNLDHAYGAGLRIIAFEGDDEKLFASYLMTLEDLYKFHWPEGKK